MTAPREEVCERIRQAEGGPGAASPWTGSPLPPPPPQFRAERTASRSAPRSRRLRGLAVALSLLAFPVVASSDNPSAPSPALAAPADLTVDASDRQLTVSWSPVAGATGYRVAARPMSGVEPFGWSEYDAASPPHAITDPWAAMSGLEYEVRVAVINDDGQTIWSPSITTTAPALRRALPGVLELSDWPKHMPRRVGDRITAEWGDSQRSSTRRSTRRSVWMWSVCDPDGSSCDPVPNSGPEAVYLIGEAARGKLLQVQRDYDLGGSSWAATAVAGVIDREVSPLWRPQRGSRPPGCEEMAPSRIPGAFTKGADLLTHLYHLESKSVQIPFPWKQYGGGAIEPLCEDLLVVTPKGWITLVRPDGSWMDLEGRVPMNLAGIDRDYEIEAHISNNNRSQRTPRVTDILLKPHSEGRWELFVTHHHFTEECIRFRLSSTTVLRQEASVSVSPSWRTVFDFEPCLFLPRFLHESGGRILTDGPEHLLVVVGDHGRSTLAQDPDSHLGKLVRIGIETGASEVLSFGFRNPQGFARDAAGNLWQTEHGPRGGDELNVLVPGANYGWPYVSYGIGYDEFGEHDGRVGARLQSGPLEWTGGHEAFALPAFAWVPSIATSAMTVNDDRRFPLWKDDLIVSSLKDSSIHRVRRNGTSVQYVERIELGYRIRDLSWMPDGRLALVADGGAVHFLSLSPESEYCNDPRSRKAPAIYTLGCGPK